MTQHAIQSESAKSAASWDLRHAGCIMRGANGEEIHEFLGMWPLKPDADLVGLANALSREVPFWGGPGKTFSEATTHLGLIRTARWFVGTSTEFGPTLYFVSQSTAAWRSTSTTSCSTGRRISRRSGARASAVRPARTRRRATSCSTSRAGRSRLWSVTTPFRASIWARSRRWPTGTRRRRSSSAQSSPTTATSRTRSTRSSPSWPSPTHSCRAAPTSTPTSQTSSSSPTCPSGWA